jgi:hypothetical protein
MLATERVWLSKVALRGQSVLRACITSHRTRASDGEALVEEADKALCSCVSESSCAANEIVAAK